MSTTVKPTETREPQVLDVYESTHGSIYQVLYVDEQIVLLRDQQERDGSNIHRMDSRTDFEAMTEQGRMELQADSDLDLTDATTVEWDDVDLIGEATASNLIDAGYETKLDIAVADDDELLGIDGVGQKGLRNLREFTQ